MASAARDLGARRAGVGAVLDFAWDAGVFTVSDAMTTTSLTRSTTLDALESLVRAGVLRELPDARAAGEHRAGRPARRFELHADFGIVAGLYIQEAQFTLLVADLAGNVLSRRHVSFDPELTVTQLRIVVRDTLDSACAEGAIAPDALLSLCVGHAATTVRADESRSGKKSLSERSSETLTNLLHDHAAVVEVTNDAQLAAAAEAACGGATSSRHYIALLADQRLCAGVVVDGHLLHGAHGGVGERFALDLVRGVDSALGLGPALEVRARQLRADGALNPAGHLAISSPDEIDARRILRLAADGDEDALRICESIGESFARVTGVLGSVFDPERIIVCGAIADDIEPVLEAARRTIGSNTRMRAPALICSPLGADVVVLGAVTRALENARRTTRSRLLSSTAVEH